MGMGMGTATDTVRQQQELAKQKIEEGEGGAERQLVVRRPVLLQRLPLSGNADEMTPPSPSPPPLHCGSTA